MTLPLDPSKRKFKVPGKPIKKKVGRPTVYDPEYHPHHAFKFCLLGCDDADLAASLDISENLIHTWMNTYPAFRDSIRRGREEADAHVAESLYHRARGYERMGEKIRITDRGDVHRAEVVEHFPAEVRAAQFWLNNRQRARWRDNPTVVVGVQAQAATINMQPAEVSQGYLSLVEGDE